MRTFALIFAGMQEERIFSLCSSSSSSSQSSCRGLEWLISLPPSPVSTAKETSFDDPPPIPVVTPPAMSRYPLRSSSATREEDQSADPPVNDFLSDPLWDDEEFQMEADRIADEAERCFSVARASSFETRPGGVPNDVSVPQGNIVSPPPVGLNQQGSHRVAAAGRESGDARSVASSSFFLELNLIQLEPH